MVEDITVALGRWSWLFVIASRSAFAYRDCTADVRHIGAELGVRYVLTGSVRKDERRVRIIVQLNDASDGVQIWADRFEGGLDAIFDIQDQVATQVAGMVAPALRSVEMQRAQRKPTDNLTAYDLFLRALQHIHRGEQANREALRLLYEAIELDPSYGAAYGLAAWCYRLRKVHGWVAPSDPSLSEGIRLAHLAGADQSQRFRRPVDGGKCVSASRRRTRPWPGHDRGVPLAEPELSWCLVGWRNASRFLR